MADHDYHSKTSPEARVPEEKSGQLSTKVLTVKVPDKRDADSVSPMANLWPENPEQHGSQCPYRKSAALLPEFLWGYPPLGYSMEKDRCGTGLSVPCNSIAGHFASISVSPARYP
jgi:hypothetical protein